jgi:polar amino acid transport system substrate-binding protein
MASLGIIVSGLATAHCDRVIQVPVSATGQSVVIDGDTARGIYPDILNAISVKDKCRFVIAPVPRARLEKLYESGKADMVVASTRSARRDEFGVFIPMIRSRAMLISLGDAQRPPFKTTQEILNNKDVRLVVVRGYDYGNAYHELIEAMGKENRVLLEVDPNAVARLMKINPNDVTIMVPTIIYSAMQEDARLSDQMEKLRFEPLDNIPWGESGVYLSKKALEPGQMKFLQSMMQRTAQAGTVHKGFAAYYPPQVLKDSIKPLEKTAP